MIAKAAARRLADVGLGPGDIAIDCGANVGEVTGVLARTGATVHAFEPNPDAFERLHRRFAGHSRVHCRQQAVLDHAGDVRLYLHTQAEEDPVLYSSGSSLLGSKTNVRTDRHVTVEAVDLDAFIRGLGAPVKVLKIDVEGVEGRILKKLIGSGTAGRIEHIFVETHDERMPELREEMAEVRAMIAERELENIHLDWH